MSLTAHPYVVLAEQQWKQQNLGGANLAPHRARRGHGSSDHVAGSRGGLRGWVHLAAEALRTQRHPGHHTARPV